VTGRSRRERLAREHRSCLSGFVLAISSAWLFFRGFAVMQLRTYLHVVSVILLVVAVSLLASPHEKIAGAGRGLAVLPECRALGAARRSAARCLRSSSWRWASPTCRSCCGRSSAASATGGQSGLPSASTGPGSSPGGARRDGGADVSSALVDKPPTAS